MSKFGPYKSKWRHFYHRTHGCRHSHACKYAHTWHDKVATPPPESEPEVDHPRAESQHAAGLGNHVPVGGLVLVRIQAAHREWSADDDDDDDEDWGPWKHNPWGAMVSEKKAAVDDAAAAPPEERMTPLLETPAAADDAVVAPPDEKTEGILEVLAAEYDQEAALSHEPPSLKQMWATVAPELLKAGYKIEYMNSKAVDDADNSGHGVDLKEP